MEEDLPFFQRNSELEFEVILAYFLIFCTLVIGSVALFMPGIPTPEGIFISLQSQCAF